MHMSGEELLVYDTIIQEQIALQELQAAILDALPKDGTEVEFLSLVRQIKQQRATLAGLWEQAQALKSCELKDDRDLLQGAQAGKQPSVTRSLNEMIANADLEMAEVDALRRECKKLTSDAQEFKHPLC